MGKTFTELDPEPGVFMNKSIQNEPLVRDWRLILRENFETLASEFVELGIFDS